MTLTEMSYYSRRMAPFFVLFLLVVLILFYSLKILFLYMDSKKVPVVFTNTIFGKLKYPKIDNVATPAGQLTYALDTLEGQPVTATASANVYFLPKSTSNFGFREKLLSLAQTFGFDPNGLKYQLQDQTASFNDGKQTLSADIASFNFEYQYSLDKDPSIFANVRVPDSQEAQEKAVEFLKSIDKYSAELAQGKVNIIYLIYDPNTTNLTVTEDPTLANMVEADFYRPDIGQYPIVSPKYFNSQNFVAMVFNDTSYKVVKAQVKFFEKSDQQVGVYPLKTGPEAFQLLQSGQAYFIHFPQNSTNITIKKMFLGYLDPDTYQENLQPVYVFLGDNDFVAYVPAVQDAFLNR